MKKVLFILLTLIFLITETSAICQNGQININTASAEDLDKLSGIGPVKAQAIIDTRPFNSVDGLIDVNGIGNATLDKIKTQSLACVSNEEENTPVEEDIPEEIPDEIQQDTPQETTQNKEDAIIKKDTTKEDITTNKDVSSSKEVTEKVVPSSSETTKITGEEVQTIILSSSSPKDIKSESDKEQLNKNKLAIYGLITFCILLVVLFGFRKTKNEKNEFK